MIRTIQTTYRYRLQPTTQQEALFRQFVGARCFVWNWGLARKREYYQATGKTLSHNALSRELTELKCQPATTWLCEIYAQSLQQALRDLERAFQAFFRRVRTGAPKKGYPKFKSKKTDPLSFRLSQHVQIEGEFVHVPKIGRIKAIIHRRIEGVTKSATFKQAPDGHWCVCLVVEQLVPEQQPRPVQSYVGVDVGLKTLGVLSNSEMIANPRFYRTQIGKLARAQRALSRKQKDSRNRGKARRKVACIYNKITNQRKDFLHKLSIDLVRRFNLISIEDLSVRGLAKTKLSTSVLDAGWGMFRSFLTYKADRHDQHLLIIGRFYPSSRLCPNCGAINTNLTLADCIWTCECGAIRDRDLNAARNIDTEGLRLFDEQYVTVGYTETQNACGVSVRPPTGGAK